MTLNLSHRRKTLPIKVYLKHKQTWNLVYDSQFVCPGPRDPKDDEEEKDPYPGRAPIPLEKLQKYQRGKAVALYRGVKTPAKKLEVRRKEKKIKYASQQAARAELLLHEEGGFLEAEEDEFTGQFRQEEIKRSVDITSAAKQFDLALQFGPYAIKYSRNGRKMLIGRWKLMVSWKTVS